MEKDIRNESVTNFFRQYCTEEWLPLIQHHQQIIEVKKNHAFIREGDPVTGIYVLLEGKVKVISHFYGQKEHIFRLVDGVQIIGHRSLFLKSFSISACALTPVVVALIPMTLFVKLFKANTGFSEYLIEFLTKELHESEEQQYMLTMDNVRQRVAYSLSKLIRIFGYEKGGDGKLAYTLPKKDIAILCNTTYESVIRSLSAFEKEGIIKGEGKNIIILDEKKLNAISATG